MVRKKIKYPWPVCQHFLERQQRLPSLRSPLGRRWIQLPVHWNIGRQTVRYQEIVVNAFLLLLFICLLVKCNTVQLTLAVHLSFFLWKINLELSEYWYLETVYSFSVRDEAWIYHYLNFPQEFHLMQTCKYMCTHTVTHAHTITHKCTHTNTHRCMHTHTHKHTHTYDHTQLHTHTHIQTHI